MNNHCCTLRSMPRQRGAVFAMVAFGLLAILGMVGLAIDAGHAFLNKTRIQNALDGAALAGAKAYEQAAGPAPDVAAMGLGRAAAVTAARAVFQNHLDGIGFDELAPLGDAAAAIIVEFSASVVQPFTSSNPGPFVRVRMSDKLELDTTFMRVVGVNQLDVDSSAVAGPSPTLGAACGIAPLVACSDPEPADGTFWGYNLYEEVQLKAGAGSGQGGDWDIGPGNYQVLDVGSGGADVREALAGDWPGCVGFGDTTPTETGNLVGPARGLNTRFGIYQSLPGSFDAELYPPDRITAEPLTYEQYLTADDDEPAGKEHRRIISVPMGNCTGTENGKGEIQVLGLGCFFLRESIPVGGPEQGWITGEFIGACDVDGFGGDDPFNSIGPKVIVLYGDVDRWDS